MTKTTGQSSSGWHRVAAFMHCPQEYVYNYLYGLRTKEQRVAPTLGTAVHVLLAARYSQDESFCNELEKLEPSIVSRAKEIVNNYWTTKSTSMNVIGVEQELVMTIGPYNFTRRVDLITEGADGNVYITDHKTCSDIAMRLKQSRFDLSLATQIVVAQSVYGERFKCLWLNLICTTKRAFLRAPIYFSDDFLKNVLVTLKYYLAQVNTFRAEMFDAPRTWHCRTGMYPCDYWKLCAYGPSALCEYDISDDFVLTNETDLV